MLYSLTRSLLLTKEQGCLAHACTEGLLRLRKKKENLCSFVSALTVCILGKWVKDKWKEVCREVLSFFKGSSITEKKTEKLLGTKESRVFFDSYPKEVIAASPSSHCFMDLLGYDISICHWRSVQMLKATPHLGHWIWSWQILGSRVMSSNLYTVQTECQS